MRDGEEWHDFGLGDEQKEGYTWAEVCFSVQAGAYSLVLQSRISTRADHLFFQTTKAKTPSLCVLAILGAMKARLLSDRLQGLKGGTAENH